MDSKIYELGSEQWLRAVGYYDLEKDKDGFIVLHPSASRVDSELKNFTTNIESLEAQLKNLREKKTEHEKYKKTDDYKESKKKERSKKEKRSRDTLIQMVFNNADKNAEADEDDDENYKDNKSSKRKKRTDTLDTTYGKRFSPVVSLLHDSIADFDKIAKAIEQELNSPVGKTRNMYRSNQISNLISAKDKKLSAVKELASVAKTVSDLEYKKDKDQKAESGSDTTKIIANIGARYLRGSFDFGDEPKGKKGKKEKSKSNFERATGKSNKREIDDDEEDEEVEKRKKASADKDTDLAAALANELMGRKDVRFTEYEKNLNMEGKWTPVIVCDPLDPEHTYKFVAINPKTGKFLKGDDKDAVKALLPRKKDVRLRFDLGKKKAYDSQSGKSYRLLFES